MIFINNLFLDRLNVKNINFYQIKKIQGPGIEPGTSSVLTKRDNHYTTLAYNIINFYNNTKILFMY